MSINDHLRLWHHSKFNQFLSLVSVHPFFQALAQAADPPLSRQGTKRSPLNLLSVNIYDFLRDYRILIHYFENEQLRNKALAVLWCIYGLAVLSDPQLADRRGNNGKPSYQVSSTASTTNTICWWIKLPLSSLSRHQYSEEVSRSTTIICAKPSSSMFTFKFVIRF